MQQIMGTASGSLLPETNKQASGNSARQQRTKEGTANPKWAEWGVYNYKAVVAYDGTNYKYV